MSLKKARIRSRFHKSLRVGKTQVWWNNKLELSQHAIVLRHVGATPEQVAVLKIRNWWALSRWAKRRIKALKEGVKQELTKVEV